MWLLALLIFKRAWLDILFMANDHIDETKKLIIALLRQPPKLHEDMKIGKSSAKGPKSPETKKPRVSSAKPKNA